MPARISASVVPLKKYVVAHKIMSGFIAIVVLGVGYFGYKHFNPVVVQTRYVLGSAATGTVVAIVSGSGQVSASNQVDLKPKVSGQIVSLRVREGQVVGAGAVIAYIDSTDAQKAVRDAQTNLDSARISLQKIQKPSDTLTITQAQNNLAKANDDLSNATEALPTAYDNAFSQIDTAFQDLPALITGLNTIVFGSDRTLGGSTQWNIDYYANAINSNRNTIDANTDRQTVIDNYNAAKTAYDKASVDYKTASRLSSQQTIDSLLAETDNAVSLTGIAVKSANNFIQLYKNVLTAKNLPTSSTADTHLATLGDYITKSNTDQSATESSQSSIRSAKQAILSAQRAITENQASLDKINAGADTLDVQSAQLTVQQRQNALLDAQNTLADYAIRAPFAGTVAKLDLHLADNVSSGTTAATMITKQEIAELSLNEIDATKVKAGQKATLTFDAIDGLTVTGEVAAIDSIGTVTQGVVSYVVKIGFDTQDARIKPGMTVNADIQTAVRQNVLVVPSSAVKTSSGSNYVLVFDPPLTDTGTGTTGITTTRTPSNQPVTIGITDGTNTEISSGLSAGEQVVTRTTSGSATAATLPTSGGNARGGVGGIRL